jgi:hypothetical protein
MGVERVSANWYPVDKEDADPTPVLWGTLQPTRFSDFSNTILMDSSCKGYFSSHIMELCTAFPPGAYKNSINFNMIHLLRHGAEIAVF